MPRTHIPEVPFIGVTRMISGTPHLTFGILDLLLLAIHTWRFLLDAPPLAMLRLDPWKEPMLVLEAPVLREECPLREVLP